MARRKSPRFTDGRFAAIIERTVTFTTTLSLRKRVRDWLWGWGEQFRSTRMRSFVEEFRPTAEMRILDVGGTDLNWRLADQPAHVVLLNTQIPQGVDVGLLGTEYGGPTNTSRPKNVEYVVGDGKSVPYPDKHFDICFSNSTIEHLFTFEHQREFADEVRRVARGIWLQTPARSFPFEPHWLTPIIHWLPKSIQRRLGRNFTVYGWMLRPPKADVAHLVDEIRLVSYHDMRELFPDCEVRRERFFGLTKSYIAVRHDSDRT
jgi:methyltransferase family protein